MCKRERNPTSVKCMCEENVSNIIRKIDELLNRKETRRTMIVTLFIYSFCDRINFYPSNLWITSSNGSNIRLSSCIVNWFLSFDNNFYLRPFYSIDYSTEYMQRKFTDREHQWCQTYLSLGLSIITFGVNHNISQDGW